MSNLTILPRSEWRARPPKCTRTSRKPNTIHELFLHWPGDVPTSWATVNTKNEEAKVLRNFQDYHMDTHGWCDIGYNHFMGGTGDVPRIWTGRGAQYLPAGQAGHNTGTLAMCLLLGPNDHISDAVVNRIRSFVRWAQDYSGNTIHVRPHSAVTSTDCPGPHIRALIGKGAFIL